ncbi:hypothetical protein FRC08_003399 [Ceratobasidium sp. 394]|nr:hypothetical protein FRC08_003399 [Ceratobasidium sp. 394]
MLTDHRHAPATGRVQDFLDSQRGLASFYATEGKQIAAAWSGMKLGDSRPRSPMLVPRAAATMGDELCAMTHGTSSEKHEAPPQDSSRSTEPLLNRKRTPRPNIVSPRQIKSTNSGHALLKPVDQDPTPNDESERVKRLAQRRNRRRARRAAMSGADEDAISETVSSQEDTGQSKKKRQKVVPKSSSKKAKVAPALLLMQTFSGQNMGKSRLTMKPSASVGVFNKGKASAKVQTKVQRAGRPDIVFSESTFLNKARPARSEDSISVDDSGDSAAHSDHSIMERTNRRNMKSVSQSPNDGSSSEQVPVDHNGTEGDALSLTGRVREASPPWDVEQTAPSGDPEVTTIRPSSVSSPPPPSKPKTAVVGVTQCSWSSKLRKPKTHTVASQGVRLLSLPPKPSDRKHQTTSSYFRATQVPVEPPVPLSPPPYGETDSIASATRDGTIRPSPRSHTDRLDPSENIALSLSDMSDDYMHIPHIPVSVCPSPANPVEFPLYEGQLEADHMDVGDGCKEWRLEVPNHREPLSFDYHEHDARHICLLDTDQEPLDWGEIDSEGNLLLDEPYDPYDVQDGPEHETYDYYNYENEPPYTPVDEDFGRENFCEGAYAEHEEGVEHDLGEVLDDTGIDEQGLGWAAAEEGDELDPLPDELEFEDPGLIDEDTETTLEAHAEEPASLVRIITEASLENDLMRSISNHWGTAHRLY